MRLPCPACGAVCSLDSWFNDQASRAMVVAAAEAAEIAGARVVRYVGLFRPKTRSLSPDKAAKLFGEIRDLAKTREINWDRKGLRRIAPGMWQEAIDKVLERSESLDRPLSNHNYLRAIAYAVADEADRAADRQRVQAENSGTWKRERCGGGECQVIGQVIGKIAESGECAEPLEIEEPEDSMWGAVKRLLAQRLSRASFELWINPLRVVSQSDGEIILSAPNAFAVRYVKENYSADLTDCIAEAAKRPMTFEVVVNG